MTPPEVLAELAVKTAPVKSPPLDVLQEQLWLSHLGYKVC